MVVKHKNNEAPHNAVLSTDLLLSFSWNNNILIKTSVLCFHPLGQEKKFPTSTKH